MSFFKMHPLIYWIGGLLIIALAGFVYIKETDANAAKNAALAEDPPTLVAVETFDPALNSNDAKEAVVRGEIGLDAAYLLTMEKDGKVKETQWVAPLRAAEGGGDRKTITHGVLETSGGLTAEQIAAWSEANGADGPVVTIRGVWLKPGYTDRKEISKAFEESGLTLAEGAIFFDPYLQPREAELQEKDALGIAGVIAGGGGVVFLYGFIRNFFRRRR